MLPDKAKRLITGRRTENAALQASFRVATETPSLVRLCDREGRGVMLLTIQRLEPSDELSVILVRAIDLQAVPLVCTGDISRLFGLSPAESRVAGSLLSGNDPSGIAEILKLSAETVRSHLKQAMAKTATHSQAQLISVLLRGSQAVVPPTPPPTNSVISRSRIESVASGGRSPPEPTRKSGGNFQMCAALVNANGASSQHSVVFIDTSVSGYEALLRTLPADADVVMIDPAQDGIAQITASLAGQSGITAVHVISHGETGTLEIGSSVLADSTVGKYAAQIQTWSTAFAPGANILLYGCDVASTPAGQSLVQSIASLTGTAVAASTHLVGDAALGGVSTLDYDVGTITTAAIDTSGLDDVLTHFRASNLTWNVTTGRTIQFNMQTSFRASYFGSPAVGSIVNVGTSLNFGDSTSTPIYLKVLSLNTLSDYFVGQMVTSSGAPVTHTYAANVNYTAYWESGNRLSSLQNFADAGWEGQTIIDVGRGTQSPVSSLAPIIQIADNSIASFQIPAIDVDGDTLVYKLGTANQFISSGSSSATVVAPAGLVVDSNSGVVTWDIRNSVRPSVATGQLWVATVMVEAHDKVTGALKSETPLDFLLQIVDTSSNKPPVFTVVPPATTINVGQTQEVVLVATDPAGALSSITALNPPIGLTTTYHASEGELHVDFTPTAAEAGSSFVVNFQALDAQGLTTNTSVTFTVPAANPIVTLGAQPAASNITQAALGTAVAAIGSNPLTVTLTSDAAFASGSSVTLSNGNLVYTPGLITAAQAGADVIHYTVTDTVTGVVTTETQTVTLSNGPAPSVVLAASPAADNTTHATLGTAAAGFGSDALSVTLTADADFATGSSVALVGGNLIYTPGLVTQGQVGADTISYTVTDTVTGAVTTETQTVTLGNGPAPSIALAAAPAADNVTHATLGTATAGLGTDALSVTLTSDADFATGSSVALVGSSLVYTPGLITAGKAGPDSITYTVTDTVTGAVTTQTQTVALGNGPAPSVVLAAAPKADNASIATLGTAAPGIAGHNLVAALTSDADFATGSSVRLVNGTLTYTPGTVTAAMAGPDALHYTVTDTVTGAVTAETQTVTLSNAPVPAVTLATPPTVGNGSTAILGYATSGFGNALLSGTQTADNALFAYISTDDSVRGTLVATTTSWTSAASFSTAVLTPGVTNYLHIEMINQGGPGGLIGSYTLSGGTATFANGTQTLITNTTDWRSIVQSATDGTVSQKPWVMPTDTPVVEGINGVAPWGLRGNISSTAPWINDPATGSGQGAQLNGGNYTVDFSATINVDYHGATPDPLVATLVSDAKFATGSSVALGANGPSGLGIVYTPGLVTSANAGTDTIVFDITDTVTGAVTRKTETVTLSNGPAPVVTLAAASANNISAATLGTAVAGFNNDPLAVTLTSDSKFTSGSSIALVNGTLVYTPGLVTAAKAGADVIHYNVTDTVTGAVTAETQTVTLGNGPAPVVTLSATPVASSIATATLGNAAPGLGTDTLSVTLTADSDFATGSSLALVGGQLVYTPGAITVANAGPDTLHYTVTDTVTGAVTTEVQTVTLKNTPPPAVVLQASPSADNLNAAVLGTATGGAGVTAHALSVTLVSDADYATGSTIALSAGKLIYTPGLVTSANAGADAISYDVTDTVTGAVTHETQTVTLGNGPAPAVTLATAPAADNAHTALLGTASPGIAGDVMSVTLTSDAGFATGSSLRLVGSQLVYTPGIVTAAKIGPDAISYTVTDLRTGAVTSETQSVTLGNGPAPVITPAASPTADRLDPAILGTAVAGVNNDPLKVTLISDSIFVTGSSIALAGGVLTYTPGLVTIGNIGADTLGYTVTDTVTGATTYQTQTLSLTLLDVKSNNTIYLTGQDNTVTGLQHRALSSGNQGAEITDPTPWIAGGTITGTPDTETIRVRGYHNTIIADGGNDTIYAGTSNEHVIVSDFNGDNIVKGFVDTTSVVLGDGSNTIDIGGYGNDVRLGDGNNSIFAGVAAIKVKVGNGDNVISTTGYGDIITAGTGHNTIDAGLGYASVTLAGGTSTVTAGGYYDTFNIAGGTTSLGGFAGFATINLGAGFGTADSIDLRDTASDSFSFKNGQMLVTQADGELVATINTPNGQVVSALDDGAGGHKIVLGLISPPAQAVITETTWGVTLDLAPATKTVHLAGYGNTVTGGNGNHLIDGDAGGLRLTLADGNNIVSASGNGDTIHLGNGNNVVSGNLGSSEIHTGAGNQTITATGYNNDIKTGAGNSTIKAGAGFSKVDAGSGINTIAVDGSQNTVITHDGDSTVQLSGWTNLIQAGAGHTLVGGGYFNTYEVTALGHAGGVEVSDFSTQYGDVLNLHDVLGINAIVSVADGAHGDLLVSVTNGATTYVAADLHGMAGTSLATLLTNHSITV
eukprot:gene8913-9001_t